MKTHLFTLLFLSSIFSFSQTAAIPKSTQLAFEGTWQHTNKYQSNTVVIQFEPGRDFALFKDIGNGMASVKILQATVQGNLLVIPAKQDQNDYVEMEVIKGKLHLRTQEMTWDEKGTSKQAGRMEKRIFKRVPKAGN